MNAPTTHQPLVGETVRRFHVYADQNDHWIIKHGGLFYVASPASDGLSALIESWACHTPGDATKRLNKMNEAKAKACERWGCE